MLSVADYQKKYDELLERRQASKSDESMSSTEKQRIADEFAVARKELRAASKVAMARASGATAKANAARATTALGSTTAQGSAAQGSTAQGSTAQESTAQPTPTAHNAL
ncbi:hypothetical protein QQS21_009646 [Conoideocrella luteorostrata]|uniref:Uncharacterized protein n=1 Tax=Conoideocrella luteorostrata TaxID=1105319 RepID=A0AAJ0FQ65_9HYPO|nr:hypothetical protein QQS21_009646 [Conoideocrella luteorostrata]